MKYYQIFKGDKPVSKKYPHRHQAVIEALEKGYVNDCKYGLLYSSGIEIKEVEVQE